MAINKFTATLNREGSTGSVRGKIPATLVSAMGGDDGDVIEFEVNGKTLVGGRIIRGKEAQKLRAAGRQTFTSPAAKPVKAQPKVSAKAPAKKGNGKVVGKISLAKPASKAPAKAKARPVKANKNKTAVKITAPKRPVTKGKGKVVFSI